ncbi:helix-turn-helix domain-containing protein [Enterococcus sp. AZ196]|uniref:helix-turn-helix domain-containing protein n=1 Tax=Enterococcus sp. AZ196 TaxID=2774659 RepID=UPI003D285C2B
MIWEKIEAVMQEKNVTPYGLAQLMGIQITRVYRLKYGDTKQPRLRFICQIARALDVETERFRIEEPINQEKDEGYVGKN